MNRFVGEAEKSHLFTCTQISIYILINTDQRKMTLMREDGIISF